MAGQRLPKDLSKAKSKCEGTVEDHRGIALDVRELIRQRVFDNPVGSAFRLNLAYPWLRVMQLNSSSLHLQLVTGRIVVVPLVSASCGVMGQQMRLECPLCARRVCTLHHLHGRVACRRCRAFGTQRSARVAMAGNRWPSGKSAASLATMVNSGQLSTHQSRAACGGGRTLVIVRRWPVSSARNLFKSLGVDRMSANTPTAALKRTFRHFAFGPRQRWNVDGANLARKAGAIPYAAPG
jgi:hypothetical protein